jgi:hypothetical protein
MQPCVINRVCTEVGITIKVLDFVETWVCYGNYLLTQQGIREME